MFWKNYKYKIAFVVLLRSNVYLVIFCAVILILLVHFMIISKPILNVHCSYLHSILIYLLIFRVLIIYCYKKYKLYLRCILLVLAKIKLLVCLIFSIYLKIPNICYQLIQFE